MKTKRPNSEMLTFTITPDYSPRVPRVALSSRVRENGRKLVESVTHTLNWRDNGMPQAFHVSAPMSLEKYVNTASVGEVSFGEVRVGKPRAVAMDGLDWEEEIFDFPVETQTVCARVVADEVAPFVFVDDEPDLEDEIFVFHTPTVRRRARVVSRGQLPLVDYGDEPLCEDEIAFPPLQGRTVMARVVRRGRLPHGFESDEDGEAR